MAVQGYYEGSYTRKMCSPVFITFCIVSIGCLAVRPVSANMTTTASSTLKIYNLTFAEKLYNPCSLQNASSMNSEALTGDNKTATRFLAIQDMRYRLSCLNESIQNVVNYHLLDECSSFQLPPVALIPSKEDIESNVPLVVLQMFYNSLLNHTAHMYYIPEQLQKYAEDTTCHKARLSICATTLATSMKELLCGLRLTILTLQASDDGDSFHNATERILREELVDQPLCSRRSIRSCQTTKSTVNLIKEFSDYLRARLFNTDDFVSWPVTSSTLSVGLVDAEQHIVESCG